MRRYFFFMQGKKHRRPYGRRGFLTQQKEKKQVEECKFIIELILKIPYS